MWRFVRFTGFITPPARYFLFDEIQVIVLYLYHNNYTINIPKDTQKLSNTHSIWIMYVFWKKTMMGFKRPSGIRVLCIGLFRYTPLCCLLSRKDHSFRCNTGFYVCTLYLAVFFSEYRPTPLARLHTIVSLPLYLVLPRVYTMLLFWARCLDTRFTWSPEWSDVVISLELYWGIHLTK